MRKSCRGYGIFRCWRASAFGVLTSNATANVDLFLRANGLREYFDFISSTSKLTGKSKHLRAIQKTFSLRAQEMLYVGDEIRDIKAAKKAAIPIAAVTWGFNSTESLKTENPEHIISDPAELLGLVADGTISGTIAKQVLEFMLETGEGAAEIVEKRGLKQTSDTGAIDVEIDKILAANADKVAEYRGGKLPLFGFFVGQTMKAMQGKANPQVVNERLRAKLDT